MELNPLVLLDPPLWSAMMGDQSVLVVVCWSLFGSVWVCMDLAFFLLSLAFLTLRSRGTESGGGSAWSLRSGSFCCVGVQLVMSKASTASIVCAVSLDPRFLLAQTAAKSRAAFQTLSVLLLN